MWSNARMDKNAPLPNLRRDAIERMAADIFNRAFGRLPRIYSVRWQDEDAGWKSMQVIAQTEDEAVSIVLPLAGHPQHLKAYRCAI